MTTRQLLRRRQVLGTAIWFAAIGGTFVTQALRPAWTPIAGILAVATVLAVIIWLGRAHCQVCQQELGWRAFYLASRVPQLLMTLPLCPHCDASIDRDVPVSH